MNRTTDCVVSSQLPSIPNTSNEGGRALLTHSVRCLWHHTVHSRVVPHHDVRAVHLAVAPALALIPFIET